MFLKITLLSLVPLSNTYMYELGKFSFIGAGATVTKAVKDYELVGGTPARFMGWMSEAGAKLNDDLICPIEGTEYRLSSGFLRKAN